MKTKQLLTTALFFATMFANAQQPTIVKDDFYWDLNCGYCGPIYLTNVNGTLFFYQYTENYGGELWKSDGTYTGTKFIKDINPGQDGSLPSGNKDLVNVNGTLFFIPERSNIGKELWKSDGTFPGTVLVKDINPGSNASNPANLTNVNGTLFFGAYDGTTPGLWKSDGTAAGTVLVKDINPGNLTNVNGTLFFMADDGTTGYELWKSDGTTAGTVFVKDINPGSNGSYLYYYASANVNGTYFFTADNGTTGQELWKSDGTAAGTVLVKDINPGSNGSGIIQGPDYLTNINGTLFFVADNGNNGYELWKSDGTGAGTVLVKDINPGSNASNPANLTNVNGTLLFTADDGSNGRELWKSDGTTAGTVLVKDIRPGSTGSLQHYAYLTTNVNGTLFFTADNGTTGHELWKSDGTAAGTVLVEDIYPGSFPSNPNELTNVNGTLFFVALDPSGNHNLYKLEVPGTSGIEETAEEGMLITPNPSSGVFIVSVNNQSAYQIEVHNSLGQLVYTAGTQGSTTTIDLQNHAAGVYTITITDGEQVMHSKVIKN